MRHGLAMLSIALAVGLCASAAGAQTEIDRLLVRVYGAVITQSDVRQARALKLVADTSSDQAALRGLENRILVLRELTLMPGAPQATDEAVAERRREWQQSLGGADLAALLSRHGMNEATLTAWMRDDARADAYLARQFGNPADPNRERALTGWLDRLRQRAGLR
jgi:hypothetical protein